MKGQIKVIQLPFPANRIVLARIDKDGQLRPLRYVGWRQAHKAALQVGGTVYRPAYAGAPNCHFVEVEHS